MYQSQVPRYPSLGKLIFGSDSSFSVCLPSVELLAVCFVDHVTHSANGMLFTCRQRSKATCVCLLCCFCSSAFTMWPIPMLFCMAKTWRTELTQPSSFSWAYVRHFSNTSRHVFRGPLRCEELHFTTLHLTDTCVIPAEFIWALLRVFKLLGRGHLSGNGGTVDRRCPCIWFSSVLNKGYACISWTPTFNSTYSMAGT